MITEIEWKNQSNEELLLMYSKQPSIEIKQEIVLRYLPMLKSIAIQMRNVYLGFAQLDDIVNEGAIAIMNAVDKYEIEKNVKFETYISKRIRGLVIDMARKQDWVPRSVRKSAKDVEQATVLLHDQLGYMPSANEIAEHLEIDVEKYYEISAKIPLFNILSLDVVLEESMESKKSIQITSSNVHEQPEQYILEEELKAILQQGIASLKEKEQLVLSLYYVEELHMKDIAQVLEVSEPRISQLHANAILKLKNYMQKYA